MMPNDQCDYQQIVTEREEQERGVQDAHQKWAKVSELDQIPEEVLEEIRHLAYVLRSMGELRFIDHQSGAAPCGSLLCDIHHVRRHSLQLTASGKDVAPAWLPHETGQTLTHDLLKSVDTFR